MTLARTRHVRIVGTGLLGTSIGLALRAQDVRVSLSDPSPTARALASDMGAGEVAHDDLPAPDLVVVAAPPDVVVDVVAAELQRWPEATVTDVASVKGAIAHGLETVHGRERYVGSHPMAGRERSGAVAARSDLFVARTWVICAEDLSHQPAADVAWLAETVGARVVTMSADEHDVAVAAVSHVPQVASSVVAAQLRELTDDAVALAGQGVRDVTRIAASDPMLWTQILTGNADAVRPIVDAMIASLQSVSDALAGGPAARAVLASTIAAGQDGRARIPGKHGAAPTTYTTLAIVIPDEPGALGRVFTHAGASGVSIEDIRIEHDSAQNAGLLELDVLPMHAHTLAGALAEAGWQAHVLETP